jgi:hypothetical protein
MTIQRMSRAPQNLSTTMKAKDSLYLAVLERNSCAYSQKTCSVNCTEHAHMIYLFCCGTTLPVFGWLQAGLTITWYVLNGRCQ